MCPKKAQESLALATTVSLFPRQVLQVRKTGNSCLSPRDRFEVFITLDRGIEFEQNLAQGGVAVVLIRAKSSRLVEINPRVLKELIEMNPEELVTDIREFALLRGECEKIIDTSMRLPDFVFKRQFAKYCAVEYGHLYTRNFGVFLSRMSAIFKDESVNYMTLDPHPDSYYQHSSFFGAASFRPSSLEERYVPVLSRERNVPQLLAGVNVGAFWGSSLKWGISCDRISWEMAVIAASEDIDVAATSGFRCMDAVWLSDYVKSQYRIKDPSNCIVLDFTERFLANYPISI